MKTCVRLWSYLAHFLEWRMFQTQVVEKYQPKFYVQYLFFKGPGVAQWLRHCATSRAVPGSNPGGVTGIFLVDTDRTMCPGVNSASKKMSTRDSPGGKGGRCVGLTTYHPCSAERQEIRGLNLPGPPWAISTACCGRDLYLYFLSFFNGSRAIYEIMWKHVVERDRPRVAI